MEKVLKKKEQWPLKTLCHTDSVTWTSPSLEVIRTQGSDWTLQNISVGPSSIGAELDVLAWIER